MSGLEIVSVVLGALPLVISGLEKYAEGLDSLRTAWKYKNTVLDWIIIFETVAARYLCSCEQLLGPLLLASDDRVCLLEEPGGEAWRRQDIQKKLQDRLGNVCSTYVSLVNRLYERLHEFAEMMALDPNNNMRPPWFEDGKTNTKSRDQFFSNSNRMWRVAKTAFEKGKVDKLLEVIEKDIFRLERLIESSSRAVPIRQEAQKKLTRHPWQSIQTAAHSLSTVISINWRCKCPDWHSSFLKLNAASQQAQAGGPWRFALLVPNEIQNVAIPKSVSWWQLNIESHGLSQHTSPTLDSADRVNSQKPKKHATKFLEPMVKGLNPSSTPTATPTSYQQSTKINSLCEVLQQTQKPKQEVGHLDDKFWRHFVAFSRPQILPVKKSDLVSIAELLGHKKQANDKKPQGSSISTREKYRIAFFLASAVLELFQTPWLAGPSMLDKICLVPQEADSRSGLRSFAILPPTRDLYIQGPSPTSPPDTRKRFWIPNEALFTLSIILLELSYLKPLSSFKTSADVDAAGNDTLLTELSIAARLADSIVSEEPSRYSDAVQRCLYCRFDTSSRDLSDVRLQEEFWLGVVEPLRELDAILA